MTTKPNDFESALVEYVELNYGIPCNTEDDFSAGVYRGADWAKDYFSAQAGVEFDYEMPVTRCAYTSEQIKEGMAMLEYVELLHGHIDKLAPVIGALRANQVKDVTEFCRGVHANLLVEISQLKEQLEEKDESSNAKCNELYARIAELEKDLRECRRVNPDILDLKIENARLRSALNPYRHCAHAVSNCSCTSIAKQALVEKE